MAAAMQGAVLLKGKVDLEGLIGARGRSIRFRRSRVLTASAALAERAAATKTGSWSWKFDLPLKINYAENAGSSSNKGNLQNLVFLPTVSDVSTTEEWQAVAENFVERNSSWRAVTVDWPGFGFSDRPPLNYTADMMEQFLVDFVTSSEGPLAGSSTAPVIAGAGHAATLAVKAVSKGYINASAVIAVAPTWAGPLPIVFGQSPEAESRYGLLRSALRAPAVGWALYNALVSSPGNIRKQYESHVYAETNNVTESIVKNRLALTKRPGARYAPAAFLTGMLDPVKSREEFLQLFSDLDSKTPAMVMFSTGSPKRSRAEMEALRGTKGVSKFVEIPGALLPQEEYPDVVANELHSFIASL